MKHKSHFKDCSAALCKDMTKQEMEEVIWYPGEKICIGQPYTHFQKEQQRINRWHAKGARKYSGCNLTFTAAELTKMRLERYQKWLSRNKSASPVPLRKINPLKR